MKRIQAMLLALIMILTMLTPAMAAYPTPETLYEDFGPRSEWTQAQKDAAEDWDEYDWYEYWDQYYFAASVEVDRYYLEYDEWYSEYYSYSEWSWEEYIREIKQSMGMPYPDGINVSINGEYQDFDGNPPIAIDGRVMVPLRAFMESLGAQVEYADGVAKATLSDGRTIGLELESTSLTLTDGEAVTEIVMDVAPYVLDGRLYIPLRFAAESAGFTVNWDSNYECAYLADWSQFIAETDSHFTSINAILAAAMNSQKLDKTYASTDVISISGTLYGETKNDTATIKVSGSSLINGYNQSGDYTLDIDLGGIGKTLGNYIPEELVEIIDKISGSKLSVILNGDSGELYMKSDLLSEMSFREMPPSAWVCIEDVMPVDVTRLVPENFTIGTLLAYAAPASYWTYEDAAQAADIMRLLFDDSFFTSTSTGSGTKYTAEVTELDMLALAAKLDMIGIEDLFGGSAALPSIKYKLSATVQNEKLTASTLSGTIKLTGDDLLVMSFDATSTETSSTATITYKGAYVGRIDIKVDQKIAETTKTVPAAPPEGETVVKYYEYFY